MQPRGMKSLAAAAAAAAEGEGLIAVIKWQRQEEAPVSA